MRSPCPLPPASGSNRCLDHRGIESRRNTMAKAMEHNQQTDRSLTSKLCKRCKTTYQANANLSSSCRYHRSIFVCRRHDDQKRYYELGPNDPPYAAKFYDCCGAEDADAVGCTTSFHVSYDDES